MKKTTKYIPLFIFALTIILADIAAAQSSRAQKEFQPFLTRGKTTWSVSGGFRVNTLDWNIASDITGTATPNVLSELTWRDLILLEAEGEVRHEEPIDVSFLKGGLHLEGKANVGIPIDGEVQDSDYNGDNRTQEFSRSISDADGGYAVGAAVAVGYKIYLTGDPTKRARDILKSKKPRTAKGRARRTRAFREAMDNATPAITVTPLIGYSVDQQKYVATNVDQVIPNTGPLPVEDFDSHYQANWYGGFIGVEGEVKGKKNMVRLRGEYHDLNYYGEGFWRGRAAFRQDPSFVHEAEGDGYLLNAEYAYALGEDYALTVDATYKKRQTDPGTDETFFVNNTNTTIRLNEVNDESYGMHVGVRYNW